MLKNVVRRKCRKELQKLIRMEQFFLLLKYSKIPKISPGAYIFQRPFLRGLYSEGLMYGGKFAFQNRLGQLVVGRKFTIFALFYFVFGANSVYKPRGGDLYSEGQFNGGFLRYDFEGLIQSNPAISKSQGKWRKVRNGGVSK